MTSKRNRTGFLDLPPEVRHEIYRHLFFNRPCPISLGSEQLNACLGALHANDEATQPTFHTEIFRVNKAISHDALRFAYSANSFRLTADLGSFCGLGDAALASIRTLAVFNNCWHVGRHSNIVWETLDQKCLGLELLIVQPTSHLLLQAIPYLKDFVASVPPGQSRPRLVLYLYVLDRHFSFDLPDQDYRRVLQQLKGEFGDGGRDGFMSPREMVMRMPKHVDQIDFVLDVSAGGVQALTEFLGDSSALHLVKMSEPPACSSYRVGSRTRHCYIWDENGA